jgi:hypothetical protein
MIKDPRVFIDLSPAPYCLTVRSRLYSYLILTIYSLNIINFNTAQIVTASCELSGPFFPATRTLSGTPNTSTK